MNTTTTETELLTEAAEWRLLSLLFDCPNPEWFGQVRSLGAEVADASLRRAAEAAQTEASEGLFHSIFGPGGPAPGREVSYRGWVQPGYLLSELLTFYGAFSYKPETHEIPDHIAVETGFISFLRLKEFYALACGDADRAEITREAADKFIAEHLSKFSGKISGLLAASGIEYLELAGAGLFRRVGPDKDGGRQIFLPVLETADDAQFECGGTA